MLPEFSKVKGIHPGVILKRELKKRNVKGVQLAKAIEEFPQTINAITKGRRGISPKLSVKLGAFFAVEMDYFSLLQASYEVQNVLDKKHKLRSNELAVKVRKAVFWDTEFEKIDWHKNRRAVIQRILERGNQKEIEAMIQYYGMETIKNELSRISNTFSPFFEKNLKEYILNSLTE